jgi:peptidoglycan hydrolase CwlO-like protein
MSAFTTINLNIVWVIALLLLVIIVLSGVKVCNNPNTTKNDNRFMDSRYSYISEPFEATPDPIVKQFGDLTQQRIDKTLRQTLDQERKNLQITNLKNQIDTLENKITVLQQMW